MSRPRKALVRDWSPGCSKRGSGLGDAQVRVLADQRSHLAEAELAAGQGLLVVPGEAGQVVDREGDIAALDGQAQVVRAVGVGDVRDRIGALRDQAEPVALAQVAGVEGALSRPAATEVRDVVRVEI